MLSLCCISAQKQQNSSGCNKIKLKYVYEGNVPGEGGENTYCYHCGEAVITRYRFEIRENKLTEGKCPKCKNQIDGVGF
ncbi:hypothetical protein BIY37_06905 [Candidatus Brocadia sapporoensis]|uniref:Uncharacterized protein n=1 Tax=Candidatus Brocadia sapporoensis TaxID=392547 RepID=A0A1V6M008_9BACT|nr:hypothetical protein BIY37_06905 [Candidatus Brocadia sapporoensis]TVL94678.1 MAG: hypothetical protein CV082_13915 [Candidatus Brocadia sp. BL1]